MKETVTVVYLKNNIHISVVWMYKGKLIKGKVMLITIAKKYYVLCEAPSHHLVSVGERRKFGSAKNGIALNLFYI